MGEVQDDTENLIGGEQQEVEIKPQSNQSWKKLRSCAMATIFFIGGMSDGVLGPSLVDLRILFSCNYDELGQAVMAKGFGVMIGSLIGAVIVDKMRPHADILASITALLWGVANAALPWAKYLSIAGILFTLQGIFGAILNVAISCLCISLWGTKAAMPLHLMHMCFTITLTIAPLATTPFLSQNITNTSATIFSPALTPRTFAIQPFSSLSHEDLTSSMTTVSRVWIPYAFIGAIAVVSSLSFLMLYCMGFRYDQASNKPSSQHSITFRSLFRCSKQNIYPIYFLISLFFLYTVNRARINPINLFIFPIAVDSSLHFSTTIAGTVVTGYSASMAVGRLLFALLSHRIKMVYLLWAQSILLLATHICILFFALDGQIEFWILTALCGLWSGPAYPSIVAWADRYLEVKGFVMATIDLGIGVGTFVSSWLSGYLFEYKGSESIFYICVSGSALFLLILFPIQIIAGRRGDRYELQNVINADERPTTIND